VTAKNGQTIFTSLLVVRDAATGQVVKKIQTIPTNTPAPLSLAPNSPIAAIAGKILVHGEAKTAVQLLNIATGQALSTLVLPKDQGVQAFGTSLLPKDFAMEDDNVDSLAWSFDGKKVAARRTFGFCVWDAASGKLIRAIRTTGASSDADVNAPRFGDFHPICFSPDGKLIATETATFTVRLWDIASGKMVRELSGHTDAISGLAFYPGGKILLSTALDGRLCIWDISTGTLKGTLRFLPSVKPKARGFEWIVNTPGREFVMSPEAKASLRWWDGQRSCQEPPADWSVRPGLLQALLTQ
jgi:WD40 repeat protein